MPHKLNDDRRHKFAKARYSVTNWPPFDAALVRRGDLTIWLSEEAIAGWNAPVSGKRGGQPIYSDLAIQTALALRLVLHLPLRQTEGALRSIIGRVRANAPHLAPPDRSGRTDSSADRQHRGEDLRRR